MRTTSNVKARKASSLTFGNGVLTVSALDTVLSILTCFAMAVCFAMQKMHSRSTLLVCQMPVHSSFVKMVILNKLCRKLLFQAFRRSCQNGIKFVAARFSIKFIQKLFTRFRCCLKIMKLKCIWHFYILRFTTEWQNFNKKPQNLMFLRL